MNDDAPISIEIPDATNSMTMSDATSIPSMSTKDGGGGGAVNSYYAANILLPGNPDEESMLSSSDGPSFFSTDESSIGEEDM